MDLGLIGNNFPQIGAYPRGDFNMLSDYDIVNKSSKNYVSLIKNNQDKAEIPNSKEGQKKCTGADCTCPGRELPPKAPKTLPYPATAANREGLRNGYWIIMLLVPSINVKASHSP